MTEPHTAVAGQRPILFERFADGSAYAFNLEYPSGVYYLKPSAAERLRPFLEGARHPSDLVGDAQIQDCSAEERLLVQRLFSPESTPRASSAARRRLNVWFHIANSCNLACSYCYIPELRKAVSSPTAGSVTGRDELAPLLSGLFSLCKQHGFDSLHLRFAGGEPLLALDTVEEACREAMRQSEQQGVAITFGALTNGTLVSDRFLRLLDDYPFTGISISLDGDKKSHDTHRFEIEAVGDVRQRRGTWNKIHENIQALKASGHYPYILTTITATNFHFLGDLVDYCVDERIGFRLSPVRDTKTASIAGIQEEILGVLKSIYDGLPSRLPISRPIQHHANFAEWSPGVKKSTACGTCRSSIAVGQHGSASTCQMRLETTYGNVISDSGAVLDRMRNDERNWRFVNAQKSEGGCSKCLWRYACSGGCPEHTMMTFATYDSPSPWCKLYGDFLPIYLRAIGVQLKLAADA